MWICPKCGREFKKTNQDHYCGKAPETVDEYIALQAPQAQKHSVKKNAIYFPYDKELPVEIITNTVKYYFQNKEEAGK